MLKNTICWDPLKFFIHVTSFFLCCQYILRGIIFPFFWYWILSSEHINTFVKRKIMKIIWIEVKPWVELIRKCRTCSHAFQWVRTRWKHKAVYESNLSFSLYSYLCESLEVSSFVTRTQGPASQVHSDAITLLYNWLSTTFYPFQLIKSSPNAHSDHFCSFVRSYQS